MFFLGYVFFCDFTLKPRGFQWWNLNSDSIRSLSPKEKPQTTFQGLSEDRKSAIEVTDYWVHTINLILMYLIGSGNLSCTTLVSFVFLMCLKVRAAFPIFV